MSSRMLRVEIGQQFGRLTVLREERLITPAVPAGHRAALCRCSCGRTKTIRLQALFSGVTISCGCAHREFLASPQHRARLAANGRTAKNREHLAELTEQNRSHDLTHHPLYFTHANIIARCCNPDSKDYKNYGAQGVKVCPGWRDVRNFVAWIEQNLGSRPEGMTLDRIDVYGDYEPGNVRWATWSQQRRNQRRMLSGLDVPGCGCPRDKYFEGDASALPVQAPGSDPLPYEYQGPIP